MRLSHTRTWKSHLVSCVIQLALSYPFLGALLYYLPPNVFSYTIGALLLVGLTALYGWEIYFSLAFRRNFECTLEADHIRCISPSPTTGQSFNMPISDISKVRVDDGKVILVNSRAEEFWLTFNYGNPTWRFVRLMEKSNPSIEIEYV